MAVTVTLTISYTGFTDNQIVTSLSDALEYEPEINGQPNPETRAAYSKRALGEILKQKLKDKVGNDAGEAAEVAKRAEVETKLSIT